MEIKMQSSLSAYKTITSPQYSSTQQADIAQANAIMASLVIALPIVVVCAIVGYRKYRATVMQQRIKRLNRLWQLDASHKLS